MIHPRSAARFAFYTFAFCLFFVAANSGQAQFVAQSTATFDENGNGSLVTNLAGVSNPSLHLGCAPIPAPAGFPPRSPTTLCQASSKRSLPRVTFFFSIRARRFPCPT